MKRDRYPAPGVMVPGNLGLDNEKENLVETVKQVQRQGAAMKEAWAMFCDTHLGGVKDPNRHDPSTLAQFLQSQGAAVPQQGYAPNNLAVGAPPPAKRPRPGAGPGEVYASYGGAQAPMDPGKEKLVGQIKAFQRLGDQQKEMWGNFCDSHLGGIRDPNRHNADVLHQFVTSHGVPENLGGAPPSVPGMDPMKDALVSQVKSFQRQGDQFKEAWASFCDSHLAGVKDPSRHDSATLQEFLNAHSQ